MADQIVWAVDWNSRREVYKANYDQVSLPRWIKVCFLSLKLYSTLLSKQWCELKNEKEKARHKHTRMSKVSLQEETKVMRRESSHVMVTVDASINLSVTLESHSIWPVVSSTLQKWASSVQILCNLMLSRNSLLFQLTDAMMRPSSIFVRKSAKGVSIAK